MLASDIEDIYPLTPMQSGILYLSLQARRRAMYSEQGSCAIDGPLDADRLRACWQSAVDTYAALRTGFHWRGLSRPVQVVRYRASLDFQVLDWTEVEAPDWPARLDAFRDDDLAHGFDLAGAPLLRVWLLKRGAEAHHLIWTYHHLVLDAWSEAIVLRHVMSSYEGRPSDAPPPFRKYVGWLAQQTHGDRQFWTQYLAGYAHRPVPIRGDGGWRGSHTIARPVPNDVRAALTRLAARTRVTLSAIMLGIWSVWLAENTATDDVVVGVTVSGRSEELPAADRYVGLLFDIVPVRIRVGSHATFAHLVTAIQQEWTQLTRRRVSLQEVRECTGLAAAELFDTVMVFLNEGLQIPERNLGPCRVSDVQYRSHSNYALTLRVTEGEPMLFEMVADVRCATAREAHDILTFCEEMLRRLDVDPEHDSALPSLSPSPSPLRKLSKPVVSTPAR